MTWSTAEMEYEGFRLLLRKPNHNDVWRFKDALIKLVCIENLLEKVTSEGLPEKEYNATLAEFDHYMCTVFDNSNEGIIFLIETYCGKRNYYYFTSPGFAVNLFLEDIKQKFKVNIDSWSQDDTGWGFLDRYPVKLFS